MGIFRIVWSQGLNQQKIKGASDSAEIVPELGRDLGKGYGHRNFCHLVKELQKKLLPKFSKQHQLKANTHFLYSR